MLSCKSKSNNFYKNNKYWYHGTTLNAAKSILKNGIDPLFAKKHLPSNTYDFGPAFYLTSNRSQAVKWAVRKSSLGLYNLDPAIVIINMKNILTGLGKEFPEMDENWARFVLNNRLGYKQLDSLEYVYGCIADGSLTSAVTKYKENKDFASFKKSVYNKHYETSYDQLALISESLCKQITVDRIKIVRCKYNG